MTVDYGFEYDFVAPLVPTREAQESPNKEDDQAYEFRLFACTTTKTPSKSTPTKKLTTAPSTAPRITLLRSPSPSLLAQPQEGRLLRSRPNSHYFANPTPTLQSHFVSSAISTASLHTMAKTPWPGTHLPWRVTRLTVTTSAKPAQPSQDSVRPVPQTRETKRSKPNKKRRILLRRRLANSTTTHKPRLKAKPIVRSKTGEILDLPPEEREKRTARNREKKLKRRQRERERKAAEGGPVTPDVDSNGPDSDDG